LPFVYHVPMVALSQKNDKMNWIDPYLLRPGGWKRTTISPG
jgi:hypothetical protein